MGLEISVVIALICGGVFGGGAVAAMKDKRASNTDKANAERKQMVELLGRVILDVDQQNGKVMNDTRQALQEWVNG